MLWTQLKLRHDDALCFEGVRREQNKKTARGASVVYEANARAERRARATTDLGAVLEVTYAATRE